MEVFSDERYTHLRGHRAYAGRQADMWRGFVMQAALRFHKALQAE